MSGILLPGRPTVIQREEVTLPRRELFTETETMGSLDFPTGVLTRLGTLRNEAIQTLPRVNFSTETIRTMFNRRLARFENNPSRGLFPFARKLPISEDEEELRKRRIIL